jgi:hypothetical protein
LLPKIMGGAYFSTPANAVHWLDLDPDLVAEALRQELGPPAQPARAGRPGSHHPCTAPVRPRDEEDLLLVVSTMQDRLFEAPIETVAGQLFFCLLSRLTELAHRGKTREAMRRGADALAALFDALRPDFRRCRPDRGPRSLAARSRERLDGLARLREAVEEEQKTFREYCGALEQAALPPPLRVD